MARGKRRATLTKQTGFVYPSRMLADVDLSNPLLWAILIGWILSVVLHEFSHGLVAYLGGDYTIRERGGLTLNPLRYVDPMMSIILPAVFLLMGGIPLPGGSTFIRRDLLRNRMWMSAVSLAGPGMNLLLFVACVLPLHPKLGWFSFSAPPQQWSNLQIFLAAMGVLQLISVVLNLVPVPPLDGFQAVSPFLGKPLRQRLITPPLSTILFLGYFLVLWQSPFTWVALRAVIYRSLQLLGFDDATAEGIRRSLIIALYGSP